MARARSTSTVEQTYGGFPGAGNPNAADVTTTPGSPPKQDRRKPGGGSSATCIGC